ncbi:uncharacterized protein DNG_07140 [Cephalotrichum gorgonifer]|uniref:Uncharacterized protein n=1 Tax=Cephalotrichum gorgonifer TaxID=2041049 RepID=A0AAE8SX46_9PEZI|nr:uncharacterized protein DNG_07140 [Cephalotrichum gorgonifer]
MASPSARRKNNNTKNSNKRNVSKVRPIPKEQQSHHHDDVPQIHTRSTPPPHPAAPSPPISSIGLPPQLDYSQISPASSLLCPSDREYPESESESEGESMEPLSSEDSESDSGSNPPAGPRRCGPAHPASCADFSDDTDFNVEELSDLDPMDSDEEDAIRPTGYESALSDQSRPASRSGWATNAPPRPRGLDREFMDDMQNLTCNNDSGDEIDAEADEVQEFMRWQKERKRRHRITHGSSVGKRTVSERGEDSDHEDLRPFLNGESPVSDRRMRRRIGEWRSSMLFPDHTPEGIPELDEPDSDEVDEYFGENLSKELPYFDLDDLEVMDMDDWD